MFENFIYRKNSFDAISKNLAIFQNNYVERLSVEDSIDKNFNILETSLNILHNYFDDPNNIIFKSVSN